VKTCSPSSRDANADPTHVTILSEKEWVRIFEDYGFVRLRDKERDVRQKIALYYASKQPSSTLGKVLNTLRI